MGGCLSTILFVVTCIFSMASLIRWFEQTADAVDVRDWNKLTLLLACPFMVWRYESKVVAGRPMPVPHHEPVKGFGGLPKGGIAGPPVATEANEKPSARPRVGTTDGPPPGTPKEFLGMPVIPPKKPRTKPAVDPDKMAKLRQKMIEQGMLKPPEDEKEPE